MSLPDPTDFCPGCNQLRCQCVEEREECPECGVALDDIDHCEECGWSADAYEPDEPDEPSEAEL